MKTNNSTDAQEKPTPATNLQSSAAARIAMGIVLAGLALFAIFAPHSIAGAEIALAIVGVGWLARLIITKRTGIRRSKLDLPIWLFVGWTVLSAFFSEEPSISLPKLQSIAVVLLFYLTQSLVTGHTSVLLTALMIASGIAGVAVSVADLARGRGVMIEALTPESPFHELQLGKTDAVWRVNAVRVHSAVEIDEAIRRTPPGARLPVSIIKKGEHADRPGFVVTDEIKARPAPSGITSSGPTHRFRASGWTRHYETFSETLQILAQLALGLGLAHLQRRVSSRKILYLTFSATALLVTGIALTAMRTTFVAFAFGAAVIAMRATRGRLRLLIATTLLLTLVFGAFAVWRTRTGGALTLADDSASLRWNVARAGLARIPLHPFVGHGMDAVKSHWTEWGFPGTDMIHLHSTPLQIAFDRGLPALLFWMWLIGTCWLLAARQEKMFRDARDAGAHGLLLGATGAIAGFFASSLVNYNFGDAEVALVFWWLMGTVVAVSANEARDSSAEKQASIH